MSKTQFNDPYPLKFSVKIECSGCRSSTLMHITRYPHGPIGVRYCPICGAKEEEFQMTRERSA